MRRHTFVCVNPETAHLLDEKVKTSFPKSTDHCIEPNPNGRSTDYSFTTAGRLETACGWIFLWPEYDFVELFITNKIVPQTKTFGEPDETTIG